MILSGTMRASAQSHTAEDIVRCIRATDPNGNPVLSKDQAVLMVTLFASVAVLKAEAERDLQSINAVGAA